MKRQTLGKSRKEKYIDPPYKQEWNRKSAATIYLYYSSGGRMTGAPHTGRYLWRWPPSTNSRQAQIPIYMLLSLGGGTRCTGRGVGWCRGRDDSINVWPGLTTSPPPRPISLYGGHCYQDVKEYTCRRERLSRWLPMNFTSMKTACWDHTGLLPSKRVWSWGRQS